MTATTLTAFPLKTADGETITAYRAKPASGEPRAVIQIAHGLAEHAPRYARLVEKLTQEGYAVYSNDHRGHGASKDVHGLGNFGPRGFQALVDDMAELTQLAKRENPGKPIVLLGHSLGSFAAQIYLLDHHRQLNALVLSGTAAIDKLLEAIQASGKPASLEAFNAPFEPARTPFDWLSRDEKEVDKYIADPLCGFQAEEASLGSLFQLGVGARHDGRLVRVRKDLPIYIISGERDPIVGEGTANTQALINSYQGAGLTNITHQIYKNGRHEMFNETNRGEVENDLLAWLDKTLKV